jgi:hypothetical protein
MDALMFPDTAVVEDAAAAAMLLMQTDPGANSGLKARATAAEQELSGLLEHARLNQDVKLSGYVERCKRVITRRNALYTRLERAIPGSRPGTMPLTDEVAMRVTAVRRWKAGDQLRVERARIISRLQLALQETESEIESLQSAYRGGHSMTAPMQSDRYQAGLSGRDDEFLWRAQQLISRRRELLGRLGNLDPGGDDWRARQVAAAIETAGGDGPVAAVIAPRLQTVSARPLADAKKKHAAVRGQIASIDPETEKAQTLEALATELEASVGAAARSVEIEQGEAASAIVAAAQTGRFEAILQLEQSVSGTELAGLVSPLQLARGGEAEWPAVIAEMVGERAHANGPSSV